jgi:hypothetical protein
MEAATLFAEVMLLISLVGIVAIADRMIYFAYGWSPLNAIERKLFRTMK